jgi:hypothetical protein
LNKNPDVCAGDDAGDFNLGQLVGKSMKKMVANH